MGTMFPIMLGLGLSAASAAGVIATSLVWRTHRQPLTPYEALKR